jgi:hypothetical protein
MTGGHQGVEQTESPFPDHRIELLEAAPPDSLVAYRGDFDVIVSRADLLRSLDSTAHRVPAAIRAGATIRSRLEDDLRIRGWAAFSSTLGYERYIEDLELDRLLLSGRAYVRDRVGRLPLTAVYALGWGTCEMSNGHRYRAPDGREILSLLDAWHTCPAYLGIRERVRGGAP